MSTARERRTGRAAGTLPRGTRRSPHPAWHVRPAPGYRKPEPADQSAQERRRHGRRRQVPLGGARPVAGSRPGARPRGTRALAGVAGGREPLRGGGARHAAPGERRAGPPGFPGGARSRAARRARRPNPRVVDARVAHRPRRDGHRLAGPPRRRTVRGQGCGQAAEPGAAGPGRRGALPARGFHPGPPRPSPHRPAHRCRHLVLGPAVSGPGAREGAAHRRVLRRAAARRGVPAVAVPRRARGRRPRSRQPHRPPRPEALQRAGGRNRPGQAARLRHRQAPGGRVAGRRGPPSSRAREGAP